MSLGVGIERLQEARAAARAIVGFSVYNLEQGLGVTRAAEAARLPVLLQAGSSAFGYAGRAPLAGIALALARDANVEVGVHLDHATDVAAVEACLELGYTSVMFDGSARGLAENSRFTAAVVERAHAAGAWVEGELAGIAGDEDRSTATEASGLTDPEEAARFVEATGVDALAVAVGNVHGISAVPVRLDLERLERIAELVPVPLVLHGASGLPQAEVLQAIELGVAKLNVNTELRHALKDALVATGANPPASDAVGALLGPIIAATEAAAAAKLCAFTSPVDLGAAR